MVTAPRAVVGDEGEHRVVVDEGAVEVPGALVVYRDEGHHRLPQRGVIERHQCVHLRIWPAERDGTIDAPCDVDSVLAHIHRGHVDGMADFDKVGRQHRGKILDEAAQPAWGGVPHRPRLGAEQFGAIGDMEGVGPRAHEAPVDPVTDELAEAGIVADVAGRPKHIYSIWKKMQRKGVPFSELYDIRAVRVLVDDIPSCYAVLGVVHQLWPSIPSEFDDYIAHPKGNDYRSLHTAVIGPGGRTLEVQIRTHQMHEHAELGVAAHWRYKEGGGADASFERKVAWMRQLLEARDEGEDALMAGFSTELVEDRVYVLTPRGEVVDLPRDGTVLDFAYAVHTEVGHRCRGAKVNGRIVPLDHQPATGDQVEILTGKTAEPRRDWLLASHGFLATGRARDKVRAWFHRIDRTRNLQAGKELLEKELRRMALTQADLAPVLAKFRLETVEDLHLALALGDLGPSQVTRCLHDHAQAEKEPAEPAPLTRRSAPPPPPNAPFTVEGVGNLLSQIARCCQPVPGDPIVGYLTRGRGVSIHREGCPAAQRLLARQPDRFLPVEWGGARASSYEVDIVLHAFDRKWLLKDLTNVIAQLGVNILGIQSRVDEAQGLAELRLAVRVADFGQLSEVLGRLSAIPGVQDARRLG